MPVGICMALRVNPERGQEYGHVCGPPPLQQQRSHYHGLWAACSRIKHTPVVGDASGGPPSLFTFSRPPMNLIPH